MNLKSDISSFLLFSQNIDYIRHISKEIASKEDIIKHITINMVERKIYSEIKRKTMNTIIQGIVLVLFFSILFFATLINAFKIKAWISFSGLTILIFIVFCCFSLIASAFILVNSIRLMRSIKDTPESMYDLLKELGDIYPAKLQNTLTENGYKRINYIVNYKSSSRRNITFNLYYFTQTDIDVNLNHQLYSLFLDENLNCLL